MPDDLTKSNVKPLTKDLKYESKIADASARKEEAKVKGIELKYLHKQEQKKSKRIEALKSNASKTIKRFSQSFQQRAPSKQEIQARRMALQQQLRRVQAQRMAIQQQGRQDNRFERRIVEQQMQNAEFNRRREFNDVPADFLVRRAQLRDQQLVFERERAKKFSVWNLNKNVQVPKVNLDMLRVDGTCNLMKAPRIWRQDNPDNNVFEDRGRPTLMDTPNVFQQTEEQKRFNILNTPHLNFGNVDTRRKIRRINFDEREYSC